MFTPLPNLDDRRWRDLVSEGTALIPVHAPEWTDHNAHDPGITLLELFAYRTEGLIYRVNRIPASRKARMLRLLGVRARPPRPARFAASFALAPGAPPVALPATLEFAAGPIPCRTLRPLTVTGATLVSLHRVSGEEEIELAGRLARGQTVSLFEARPAPDDSVVIGIASRARPGDPVTLHIRMAGAKSGREERRRALEEELRQRASCRLPPDECGKARPLPRCDCGREAELRISWERLADDGTWRPATVFDGTRELTEDGPVVFTVPPGTRETGRTDWFRVRVAKGEWDSPRTVRALLPDTVEAEQAVPASHVFAIMADATIEGSPPPRGGRSRLALALDTSGRITSLSFGDQPGPAVAVLDFRPPGPGPGLLTLDLVPLGEGDGAPWQEMRMVAAPALLLGADIRSREEETWRAWRLRDDLLASGPADPDFVRSDRAGFVRFGDGAAGRAPPPGSWVFGRSRSTLADAGALPDGVALALAASPRNEALTASPPVALTDLASVTVAYTIEPGRGAETLAEAIARAAAEREVTDRAVTLQDYERLALATPRTEIARAMALADVHPGLPGITAPGHVAVVVIPDGGVPRPMPSPVLLRKVSRHLRPRRLLGTRVRVVAPSYREIAVRAEVEMQPRASAAQVRARIETAVDAFLDPLRGGPDGMGWPLGRDVYRSDLMALIDGVQGVDHVASMELLADGEEPQCGDLCLGPLCLPSPGHHTIEVAP